MPRESLGLSLSEVEDALLPLVSRPARYLPLILGLRERGRSECDAVLAAPDLLEATIMHPVIPALYHGLADAGASPELAFVPWIDLEGELSRLGLPLFTLESRRPLSAFDLVLVPVLKELMATGVLELLDLGGVPLLARDRAERDPLVVGAGPGLANPEPFAPFFDATLLGDPEAILADLVRAVARHGRGEIDRATLLDELARTPGVYVPSAVEMAPGPGGELSAAPGTPPVRARYLAELPPPAPPLQPLIETRSEAFELEVARGCPRGCRFCQPARMAGPVREHSPNAVLEACDRAVRDGGWEEVTLGGLMPPDWTALDSGVELIGRNLRGTGVALALNAASGERLDKGILAELSRVRRTALAFAPEAGTERLRRVIGKPMDEDRLLATVREASALGWPTVKLHFMIGLPTETDDDLVAIADLCERIRSQGQRPGARFSVQVSVHPFVPRAQTPFQWEGMLPLEELRRRLARLRSLCRRRPLRLRWGQPEVAQLEALISRGDRHLGEIIVAAYRAGARLDAWSELVRPAIWWRVSREAGIDVERALGPRPVDRPLPWSHLVIGDGEASFSSEREAARRGELTRQPAVERAPASSSHSGPFTDPDPQPADAGRGLFAGSWLESTPERAPTGAVVYGRGRARRRPGSRESRRYRLRFSKTDPVRFVSHLDVVRLLGRSLRRAGIGVAYSTGYSRHPKLSFGPPLPVGMIGRDEYFDVELTEERPGDFVTLLNSHLPDGIRILDAVPIVTKVQSLMSLIDHADYRLSFPPHARRLLGDPEPSSFRSSLEESIRHFFSHDRAYVIQRGPDGERPVEITTGVRRLVLESDGDDAFPVLSVTLRVAGEGAVRPLDLASFLLGEDRLDPRLLRVERLLLYSLRGDSMVTPLEAAAGEELIGALEGPADGPSSSAGRPDVQRDRHQRRPGRDPHRHSRRW